MSVYDNQSGWLRRVEDRACRRGIKTGFVGEESKTEAWAWKDSGCCILKSPQIVSRVVLERIE